MISQWFAFADQGQRFPEIWMLANRLKMPLRYGENPHQQAALYEPIGPHCAGDRPGRSRCRARNSATTISTTPMRRSSSSPNFVTDRRRSSSSSTPTRAESRAADSLLDAWNACACVRQRLGVRRDRRDEPPARRRDGGSDHANLHRSRGRAGCGRGRQGDLREEEEPSPAADRRPSGPEARRARRSPSSPAASWCRTATMARSLATSSRS